MAGFAQSYRVADIILLYWRMSYTYNMVTVKLCCGFPAFLDSIFRFVILECIYHVKFNTKKIIITDVEAAFKPHKTKKTRWKDA